MVVSACGTTIHVWLCLWIASYLILNPIKLSNWGEPLWALNIIFLPFTVFWKLLEWIHLNMGFRCRRPAAGAGPGGVRRAGRRFADARDFLPGDVGWAVPDGAPGVQRRIGGAGQSRPDRPAAPARQTGGRRSAGARLGVGRRPAQLPARSKGLHTPQFLWFSSFHQLSTKKKIANQRLPLSHFVFRDNVDAE